MIFHQILAIKTGKKLVVKIDLHKKEILVLIAVILFGGILRFFHLERWSFWIDEVLCVLDAQDFSFEQFQINPVPYIAVRLSISIFGLSEFGSRVIPAFVGIASILLIYSMGKSLISKHVGILSALFLATLNWHVYWSQNARAYVFTLFFALLATWFFYLAIEQNRARLMLVALASSIFLIASHTLSSMLIPALAVYSVGLRLSERKHFDRRYCFLLLIFFVPLGLPLVLLAFPGFQTYLFSGWGLNEWKRSPLYIISTLVYGLSVPVTVAALSETVTRPIRRPQAFLLCYAGVPLILFLAFSQLLNVAGYYLFFTVPAYLILAASVCERIWVLRQISLPIRSTLPVVIIMVMLSQNYIYFRLENGGRPKWKEAFGTIESKFQENDRIVLSVPQMGEYYVPKAKSTYIKEMMNDLEGFEREIRLSGRRIWFLVDVEDFNIFDSDQRLRHWIRKNATYIKSHSAFSRYRDRSIHVYLLETN